MWNKEKNIDIMTTKVESSQKKSIDKEKNINKEQIRILEKDKIESDISTDVDSTDQRKQLALEVQKTPYVQELNNLKPAVMSNTAALGNTTDNTKEDQESWFSKNKALLLWAWWIGLGAWLLKPWNWFSDKDESKESSDNKKDSTWTTNQESKDNDWKNITVNVDAKEKKNWFARNWPWVFWWAATVWTAYWFKDKLYKIPLVWPWLDDLFNQKLSFENAMSVVEGNMNNANEDHLKKAPKLEWNKDWKTLKAFGQSFEIDLENKKIKWLDITFRNYEDLITTAILVWSAKDHFTGKCSKDKPFSITPMWWDIEVALAQNGQQDAVSGKWNSVWTVAWWLTWATLWALAGFYLLKNPTAWIVGTAAGGIGWAAAWNALLDHNDTLSQICPTLNEGLNKQNLQAYLNNVWWWIAGKDANIEKKAQTTDKKVNSIFVNTLKKIENTRDDNDDNNVDRWTERNAAITNYDNRPDVFELNAWGCVSYLHAKLDSWGKVISVTFEDTGLTFTWPKAIEQALHLWLFVNQCEKELCGKWNNSEAFRYFSGLTWNWKFDKWIWFANDSWYNAIWSVFHGIKLSKWSIEKNIPNLLEWDNIDKFIEWLNSRKSWWSSLWTNKSYKGRTNTYLEKLPPIKTKPTSQVKKAA